MAPGSDAPGNCRGTGLSSRLRGAIAWSATASLPGLSPARCPNWSPARPATASSVRRTGWRARSPATRCPADPMPVWCRAAAGPAARPRCRRRCAGRRDAPGHPAGERRRPAGPRSPCAPRWNGRSGRTSAGSGFTRTVAPTSLAACSRRVRSRRASMSSSVAAPTIR